MAYVDYEKIHEFRNGSEHLELDQIYDYYYEVKEYIEEKAERVYSGDSYFQDELSHFNLIEETIAEYDWYIEEYYKEYI